jgi:hypothetical protein
MDKTTDLTIGVDEDGEEYTSLIALVIENKVELAPLVRAGDTATSVENRVDALGGRFGSHPSDQKYLGIVNLYRTGKARPSEDGSTSSAFEPQGRKLALQAVEDIYDQVWPAVGELSQQFVHGAVLDINSSDSVYRSSRVQEAVASRAIEPWIQSTSMGDLLRKLLFEEEKEFLAKGAMTQKIGFVTRYGAAMMALAVPYEKYRWGRAVAEIARKVDARKIIQITGGFLRDPETGEKDGHECLWGLVINPDGTIEVSAHGVYARDNGHLRVSRGITAAGPTLDKQYLIPGWRVVEKGSAANSER